MRVGKAHFAETFLIDSRFNFQHSTPEIPMSSKPMKTETPQPTQVMRNVKVATKMFRDSRDATKYVATKIADLIRERHAANRSTVLGLATGSTPIGVYRELARMHKDEGLDLSRVITFNLDEYWPMEPDSIHSYHRFMTEHLFSQVNIDPKNIHIPSGRWGSDEIQTRCEEYERMIELAGGIDMQILGIGRDGHIGFNEPGSDRGSKTRFIALDPMTRLDAAQEFGGEDKVPSSAITMGVDTIFRARRVFLMALGEKKAWIIRKAIEDGPSPNLPASFLQNHQHCEFIIDEAAAGWLTDIRTPWLNNHSIVWTPPLQKQALIWLSQKCQKPLLKLDTKDFLREQLYGLLHLPGGIAEIRETVFEELLAAVCSHPGGKTPTKAFIFSPHPDDDVISMGGTFINLVNQGNEVHVAYMTSGNVAVRDDTCLRHIDYVEESSRMLGILHPEGAARLEKCRQDIHARSLQGCDSTAVLELKALIRKTEAESACELVGVPASRRHFLNLPFYRTGKIKKNPMSQEDIQIVANVLRDVRPKQIYFAGDLSDPHGTHRVCARVIIEALQQLAAEDFSPEVWMYRGAWQEYEPHELERVVPLSPEVMLKKKMAILRHESQKDGAMFMGTDEREFWIRAEERTRQTANIFNDLGLPEFFALEGFVRYQGQKL